MTILAAILVTVAVALNLASAIGVLVMRDPYQRLHYLAPPASLAPALLTVALFLVVDDPQAGLKMLLLTLLLNTINGVVTHATARAHRIRQGHPFGSLTDEERAAEETS